MVANHFQNKKFHAANEKAHRGLIFFLGFGGWQEEGGGNSFVLIKFP
jgi:hypothetical protein